MKKSTKATIQEPRGWKTLESRVIHKNAWYSLREDDVLRPKGGKGKYYVVDFNSVAVIAEDADGCIHLVGQMRYPTGNCFSWEIITGGCKEGDDPLSVAKKELQEETGITADEWIRIGIFNPMNGVSSATTHIFLARGLRQGAATPEETEDFVHAREPLNQIKQMIAEGQITCGITITTIYKYILSGYAASQKR